MAGDVSRRRYLRLRMAADAGRSRTAVLAGSPVGAGGICRRTLATTRLLEGVGVRVPAILDADCDPREGVAWTLLEDLGERTLYDLSRSAATPWDSLEPYFVDALEQLPLVASLPRRAVGGLNPPLDAALLRSELDKTRAAYLDGLGLADGSEDDRRTEEALDELCERLGEEPPVPCHRDFGARNLVPLDRAPSKGTPRRSSAVRRTGVLDHQDLRLGPPLYDLASLLNDSLFPPPEAEERLLGRAGVRSVADRERYHRAAAQRTLKAVGTYAQAAAEGFSRHLELVAPTLERCFDHLGKVPESAGVAAAFRERWSEATDGLRDRGALLD